MGGGKRGRGERRENEEKGRGKNIRKELRKGEGKSGGRKRERRLKLIILQHTSLMVNMVFAEIITIGSRKYTPPALPLFCTLLCGKSVEGAFARIFNLSCAFAPPPIPHNHMHISKNLEVKEGGGLLLKGGVFSRTYGIPKIIMVSLSTYESRFGFGKPWCLVLDQWRWRLVT